MFTHLFFAYWHIFQPFDLFGRGGGGGSGGGGGGGGLGIIMMIGYLPTHFVTKWLYVRFSKIWALSIGVILGLIVSIPCFFVDAQLALLVGIGAGIGVYSGLHDWLGRIKNRIKAGKSSVQFAARTDPIWNEAYLMDKIARVYADYQKDWSEFNVGHIQTYTSPRYSQHAALMLAALYEMGRQNIVADPKLIEHDIVDVIDQADNDQDNFSALIIGKAHDSLINRETGKVLYTDNGRFEELWWFDRDGNDWKLMRIDQATADGMKHDPALERFAAENQMFYSLDWGRLLLPQRGQLFSEASFKNSDINNHVIGTWGSNIVQMYTYNPTNNGKSDSYLIGQLTLPKSYGGIIVKQRAKGELKWLIHDKPRGYREITMEWPDFNAHYHVYATDRTK